MTIYLVDKQTVKFGARVIDANGFMRAPATLSRVGIQRYTAKELGLQDRDPGAIVLAHTPEEECFKPESMASFAGVAVTDDHPPENINARNSRKYSVGWVGDQVTRDADHTVAQLTISDSHAVQKVVAGKVEISNGYACVIDATPGEWNGQKYDVIKRNLVGNHVALVDAGRCGGSCRILDGACQDCGTAEDSASCNCHGGEDMTGTPQGPQLVQRVVDGITVEVTAQGAQVIDKLQTQLADANKKATDAGTSVQTLTDVHAKVIETKDGEIAGLKAQLDDTAIDARITARAELLDGVRKVMGKDYDGKGKTSLQMMQDAVSKAMGAEAIAGKSEDYVSGLYGAITSAKGPLSSANPQDSLRRAVLDSPASEKDVKDAKPSGRDAYLSRLNKGALAQQGA